VTRIRVAPITDLPRAQHRDPGLSPPDEELAVVLRDMARAEDAAARGQWVKAAARFQELLDRHGRAVVPVGDRLYLPAWRYVALRLLALDEPALARYRAAYGQAARRALERASDDRSRSALLIVARRYPVAPAGLDALERLADLDMQRGRALAAARFCLTRLELDPAPDPPSDVLAKLALAVARSGRRSWLAEIRAAVQAHLHDTPVRRAGLDVPLGRLVAALLSSMPDEREPEPGPAIAPRAVLPEVLLWRLPLEDPDADDADGVFRRTLPGEGARAPLPPFCPARRDGILYCQSATHLRAVDLATGRILGEVRFSLAGPRVAVPRVFRRPNGGELVRRHPGVVGPALLGRAVGVAGITFLSGKDRFQGATPYGRLDVFAARPSDGWDRTLWSVNTRSETEQAEPEGPTPALRVVSCPVRAADVVCVAARYAHSDSDAFLLGYAAADGRRLWRRRVAAATWAGDPAHRSELPDGSPPVARRGVVYYASDLGTVAAVEASTGELLWVTRYEHERNLALTVNDAEGAIQVAFPPNPLVIVEPKSGNDGALCVLPSDSKYLYVLNLRTGQVRWRRKRTTDDAAYLYLLAADRRGVYVSGNRAACFDPTFSLPRWRSPVFGAFPAGRGVVARDAVLCPLENGIAVVDLKAPDRKVRRIAWDACGRKDGPPVGPGNLTLADGCLVVSGRDALAVFADAATERRLEAKAREEPDHPAPLLELAAIHRARGQYAAAAEMCSRALRRLRAGHTRRTAARALLADACEELARRSEARGAWAEAGAHLEAAAAAVPDPADAARIAIRRARALEKAGRMDAAAAALDTVLEKHGDRELEVSHPFAGLPAGLRLRARALAAAELGRLIAEHGARVYAPFERRARELLATSGPPAVVRRYPNSSVAATVRLDRASRALKERRLAAASGHLLGLRRLRPATRTADTARLAKRIRETSGRRPEPARPGRANLLELLWRAAPESAPTHATCDAARGARAAGQPMGRRLLFAAGKSLEAYDMVTGRRRWRSGVGWLGVSFRAASVAPGGHPRPAIELAEIIPGQPAEAAGLQEGDLLLAFDGHPVRRTAGLPQLCGTTLPGRTVEVTVLRPAPRGRLRKLDVSVHLGDRPDTVREGPDWRPIPTSAHEFIRAVGVEGNALIAEADQTLLWVDRETGRRLARTFIAPMPEARLHTYRREYATLLARGPTPRLGDGCIVAATGAGELVCLELLAAPAAGARRRWSVNLAAGNDGRRSVLRLALTAGRAAALSGRVDVRTGKFSPRLQVFDVLSGRELVRRDWETEHLLDECHLAAPEDGILVVAVRGEVTGLDLRTGKTLWTLHDEEAGGRSVTELHCGGGRLVALADGRTRLVSVELRQNGGRRWTQAVGGVVRRLLLREGRVVAVFETGRGVEVACLNLPNGRERWRAAAVEAGRLRSSDEGVPYAEVIGGRLFLALNLRPEDRKGRPARVVVVRISDGKRLGSVGVNIEGRYNVLSGKARGGVLGLVTEAGLFGLSTGEPERDTP
jgi:outer membrane protein assembly factor BamB/tetratricopeptide (TPR) repeat protein